MSFGYLEDSCPEENSDIEMAPFVSFFRRCVDAIYKHSSSVDTGYGHQVQERKVSDI